MTRRLSSGDVRFEVAVRSGSDRLEVLVDGRTFSPDVSQIAPGRFRLRQDERGETFDCVRDGETIHVFWRGAVYTLTEEGATRRTAQRHASNSLTSPMPGKVIKVNVQPGQHVARGEEILVIEAMKMENAVRAPRDGRVLAVAAKVGESVSPGVVLVELE